MESNNAPKVTYGFRYWLVPPWSFSLRQEEKLYLEYTKRQKQRAVPRLLVIGVLIQAFAALVPGERDLFFAYSSVIIALFANLTLAALYGCVRGARTAISHAAWLVLWAQLLVSASRRLGDSYNELLGWAVVLQYFTLAALPFQCFLMVIYSILSFAAFLLIQYYNASTSESRLPEDFVYQQLANGAILISATLLGGTAFAINENQQRRAFQETKRSLRDKLTIEQQSKEQERLLLSVLPEHVAVQMRQDLGLIDTQFKKIYMSRHENVSILYADIVGFTAISSTYSAQDLVAILNELFARFDRLAEKYHQLRIKILGDCYYCISGAPVERPDHAVLCVHMGLSMVKAIKYVQQTTNSPVDMRVGIHTGAVLAGVLGQRQWQFDVYSRDVELANKMESSGMAGRVHVSEVTLGFLKDEFEVEPAYGEKREEMLRQAGIKTYFIVKVLKPWGGDDKSAPECEGDDALSDLRDDDEDSVLSPEGEKEDNEETKIHNMLVEELVNRDDDKELADGTNICLMFKSSEAEECYVKRSDPCPTGVLVPPLFLLPPVLVLAAFALPLSLASHLSYAGFVVEAGLSCIIFYVTYRLTQAKQKHVNPKRRAQFNMFNLGAFSTASFLPLFMCGDYENKLQDGLRDDAISHSGARRCIHPSYYYHLAVYTICCVLWVAPATCSQRITLLVLLTAVHAFPAAWHPALLTPRASLDKDPYLHHDNLTMEYDPEIIDILAQIHRGRHILMLSLIALGIMVFDRYLESLDRARHSRGERMRQQAEQAGEIRRRNQALVYNVLPPHVARHFMGAHRNHRDLYSQSYAEVGVLFASMPNFTEFYSEETVNNQGLECLRFLNEVISDFDLLLEDPKFNRDIIKIKTISSTYMAASGLNPTRQMQPSDGTLVRWAHLDNLVEFALELQRVLAAINEQSFNHFVLRMGVNHGPITAGVIGARKPHYDIWGNTVNVASRMESTGKAGCIQVTEETCHILEEFGYYFEQRGLVAVKGKGQLMTYYLQGKHNRGTTHKPQSAHTMHVRDVVAEAGVADPLLANGAPSVDKLDDTGPDKPLLP